MMLSQICIKHTPDTHDIRVIKYSSHEFKLVDSSGK